MKEAFSQLSEEGFRDKKEESNVRLMLHHAYNDYYYRSSDGKEISANDKNLFYENGKWLIDNLITDNVLKAELYREIGEFEIAHDILESVEVEDLFLRNIVSQIQEKLRNKDCRVFKIQ